MPKYEMVALWHAGDTEQGTFSETVEADDVRMAKKTLFDWMEEAEPHTDRDAYQVVHCQAITFDQQQCRETVERAQAALAKVESYLRRSYPAMAFAALDEVNKLLEVAMTELQR